MFKQVTIFSLLACFVLTGVGCWDSRDIERISFPYAAGYDLHSGAGAESSVDPREIPVVDVTVLNPNLSPEAQSRVSVETAAASIVSYARDKRAYTTPEIYFPSLNQVLLQGEDLARTGLYQYYDSLLRVPNIAVAMNLAVVEGRTEDVLKTPSRDYVNMGVELRAMLRNSERKGFVPSTTLHQFVLNLRTAKNPVVPVVVKAGETIDFGGLAVFKKDRMIDRLNAQDTRSVVLLRGVKCTGSLPFFLGQEGAGQDRGVVRVNNSRKVEVTRDGDQYHFVVKIRLDGTLAEHTQGMNITPDHLREIEDKVADDIQRDCTNFIRSMQQNLQVDCIDIQKYALAKWRRELQQTIDQEDFIRKADIRCQVECHIHNTGETR